MIGLAAVQRLEAGLTSPLELGVMARLALEEAGELYGGSKGSGELYGGSTASEANVV
jgi:hypothetical protein